MTGITASSLSYPSVPSPPAQDDGADSTVVELHPQSLDASLLRIASVSADQEAHAPVTDPAANPADCHFVSISDTDSRPAAAEDPAAINNAASTSGDRIDPAHQQHESAYALPHGPPKVAVHASAVSNDGPPHQAFTISAGPRERRLYYLWSPTSKQHNAAGSGASYVEALDQGKKQLLKDGSSPFADVTKLQVARMATFLPDAKPKKHARRIHDSWWSWIFCQRRGSAKYTIDEEDAQDDICHPEAPSGWRWKVMLLTCCLIAMISYVDRAAISVALIPMSVRYNWNNAIKGAIGSVFFVGYTVTNVCGGYLAARYTAKLVLGLGVLSCSVFTILMPVAASSNSVYVVLACACLMGAGEGVIFPAIQHLQGKWLPPNRRTFANTLLFAGATCGTILSYATATAIMARWAWQGLFVVYGVLGLLWCVLCIPLLSENPPNRQNQYFHGEPLRGVGDVPWEKFVRSPAVWAIFMAQCTQGIMYLLVFLWIPSYFYGNFGVDMRQSAYLSLGPWCCAIVATLAAGLAADALHNRGVMELTNVRKLMQGIGSIGPAGCLFYLAWLDKEGSAAHAAVILSIMLSLEGFSVAGADSNHLDLSAKFAGIIFGLTNGLSGIVESLSIYGTGLILDSHHSWPLVFEIVASVSIAGGIFYILFASSKQQSW